jgi:hypothetical protein
MISKIWKAALAAMAAAFLAAAFIVPASALVTDPNKIIPERSCSATQNVCYVRVTVNFNDPRISSGVWFATLPKNAYVLAIDAYVGTAFNAATTNYLSIGATATGTDFLATTGTNASVTLGSTGTTHATSAAGLGLVATGSSSLQTAANGAVPVYIRYQQSGTAATAGVVTVVVAYIKNDDN